MVILAISSLHGKYPRGSFLLWAASCWLLPPGIYFLTPLVELYLRSRLNSTASKCFFLILFAVLLLRYPGARVLIENNGVFSVSLSILFCVLTPVIVIICWPKRQWVMAREGKYAAVTSLSSERYRRLARGRVNLIGRLQ